MKRAQQLILGNIITMDDDRPTAKAMTVVDGVITYVGAEKNARALCDANTQVLDYGENYVYPGFMESHAHGMAAGWRAIGIADVFAGTSYQEYCDLMRDYVQANPGRSIYVGSGWIEKLEGTFNRSCLDAIRSDVPIVLHSSDGHSMLLNGKAMELYDITAESAKRMEPGEVELDAAGQPNGLIHETPVKDILTKLPMTMDEIKQYLLAWQDLAIANGFTAHSEAGSKLFTLQQNEAYSQLSREGKLKIRSYSYHTITDNTQTPEEDIEETWRMAQELNTEYHKIVGLKTFLDGVLEARTAWMLEEYLDEPGFYGVKCYSDHESMVRLLKAAAKYNLGVEAHSMGDAATKFMLDCIEEAQAATGNTDQRNALAHLQFITPEDVQRMADTNTVAVVPPMWTMKVPGNYENELKYVGEKMAAVEYPIKSFFDAGAVCTFHSDYPAGPIIGIPLSIFMAEQRYYPDFGEESRNNIGEAITRRQSLLAMTKNVAKMFHEENRLGSLEIGKIANATVFDKDFLHCSAAELLEAKLVATVIDGQEVFKG